MTKIEKITRLPLRDIWKDEARDFTTWLEENIDALNDVLDFEVQNVSREQSTGNFNVDLLGEDSSGGTVVIENQLGKSDHDHLGKVITYLSSFDATKAIWIASDARPEHIKAVTWLNEARGTEFYFLKLEAIKIGDSNPAPLFTLIVGPSELLSKAGSAKKEISERHKRRYQFWERMIELSKAKGHKLLVSSTPNHYTYLGASSGFRGINYQYWLNKNSFQIKIYIDRGKESGDQNLVIFNQLLAHKDQIETDFGNRLEWNELEEYRACTIGCLVGEMGWVNNEEEWNEIQLAGIEQMEKLISATKKLIAKIKL